MRPRGEFSSPSIDAEFCTVEALYERLKSSPQSTKLMRAATRTFVLNYIPQGGDLTSCCIKGVVVVVYSPIVNESLFSDIISDLPSHLVLPERDVKFDSHPSSPINCGLPDLFS